LGRVKRIDPAANTGKRIVESTVGAPTIADAMMAAAHNRAFAMNEFRVMAISSSFAWPPDRRKSPAFSWNPVD
jgi:hypothetical protein